MKGFISQIANTSENDRVSALKTIIEMLNANPQSFQAFKQEFISNGLAETHIGAFNYILEHLEFIPLPSPQSIVGQYVYRGSGLSPSELKQKGGFQSTGRSRSIWEHQRSTGASIYVGASKDIVIAVEHAFQHTKKFVYQIETTHGICVNEFLHPLKGLSMEQEVVFAYEIPISQVRAYAIITAFDEVPSKFYPI